MSENRPFYGKDGGKYRDYYEKEAADNRYDQQQKIIEETRRQNDLLEKQQRKSQQQVLQQQMEQEMANKLAQQKMAEERANAEKIAQATVQAERERALYQATLQQQQHDYEEEQRKIRLCDDLGVDYEEIKLFENYLSEGDNALIEKIDSLKNDIERKERLLEEYRNNKPDENKIINSFEEKLFDLRDELDIVKSGDGSLLIIVIMTIIFGILLAFMCIGADDIFFLVKLMLSLYAICTIPLVLITKVPTKIQTNKLKAQIKEIEKHKKIALDEFNKTKENKLLEYNEKVSNYLKDIDKAKKEYEELENQNKQLLVDKGNKFIEFRLTHYNEEMEMLLNKLKLKSLKVIDMAFEQQNGYIEEYASKKGTVKDYIKYIREVIRNS